MIGHLALADEVLGAGDLVGEHRRSRSSACMRCSCGGTLLAAAEARQRERRAGVPAPARAEHRRVEQRLDQHVARRGRVQVARRRRRAGSCAPVAEREHDGVLGRRRLQLEVERAAEALAQRQAPGAVDAAAEGRVDHELHAAGLVEEALEHDASRCVGSAPSAACARREVVDELRARPRRRAPSSSRSQATRRVAPPSSQPRVDLVAQPRHRRATARRCGPAPRRARTGWSAAAPCASSTRTAPALDAQDAPRGVAELEDVAGQALDREVLVDACRRRCLAARARTW